MDPFERRDFERAIHAKKLETAKSGMRLSAIFGALTVAASLWINVNMDDGELFDLHKYIPEKVEEAVEQNPAYNREALQKQGDELADAWEKNMRLSTIVFPLFSGLFTALWFRQKTKLEKEQQENPHLQPRKDDNKGPGGNDGPQI